MQRHPRTSWRRRSVVPACLAPSTTPPAASSSPAPPRLLLAGWGGADAAGSAERVLSLGYQEHDAIFALGVTPVAVRYWFGDEGGVIFPWAEDVAAGADPEILNMPGGLNFERIAALRADASTASSRPSRSLASTSTSAHPGKSRP